MKNIQTFIPYVIALLPQFLFENYLVIVFTTFIMGLISYTFVIRKYVFLKIFSLELILFSIIFQFFKDRVHYVDYLLLTIGDISFLKTIFFSFFNALNIAVLFYFGYLIARLFRSLKLKKLGNGRS